MKGTPGSLRLHIGILGRRNVGKSSLINSIAGMEVAITAPEPGTTTDPVKLSINLNPLGPVVLIDTAGIDDMGDLGNLRIDSARKAMESMDMAMLVVTGDQWGSYEEDILNRFPGENIPVVIVQNKSDLGPPAKEVSQRIIETGLPAVAVSALKGIGMQDLIGRLIDSAPASWIESPPVLGDLIKPGQLVVQVMPIDIEAPVGRILLPQVQAVREVLDSGGISVVMKETEFQRAMEGFSSPPHMVITDSQAFGLIAPLTPESSLLTSYSILFARHKGDLASYIRGTEALDSLSDGDQVLMAEACVHHPLGNDIGRVQIPRRISLYSGKKLNFTHVQGKDFPEDLSPYRLVVHCGGCVVNRRGILHRIQRANQQGVAITNYGVLLAKVNGILNRAVKPFISVYPELENVISKISTGGKDG